MQHLRPRSQAVSTADPIAAEGLKTLWVTGEQLERLLCCHRLAQLKGKRAGVGNVLQLCHDSSACAATATIDVKHQSPLEANTAVAAKAEQ